ncbi:unnamed protein product, partial [Callosobruchus maculatus]
GFEFRRSPSFSDISCFAPAVAYFQIRPPSQEISFSPSSSCKISRTKEAPAIYLQIWKLK